MNDVPLSHAAFWLGHPGSLVPFHGFVAPFDVEEEDDVIIQRGMGGGVRARAPRTRAPRTWDIDLPTVYPRDVKHLRALTTQTRPPYVLVTSEAQVSNVLTPERSTLQDASPELALGGWWPIAGEPGDGAIVRLNPSAAFGNLAQVVVGPCPIPPLWTGRSVTVSAHVATARTDGARVVLRWLDAAGSLLSGSTAQNGNFRTGMDGLRRSTATGTPPAGAAACRVDVQYAEVIAQAQVTWTDTPTEWDVGAGADRVVLHGLARQVTIPPGSNTVLQDVSFTATEVGP